MLDFPGNLAESSWPSCATSCHADGVRGAVVSAGAILLAVRTFVAIAIFLAGCGSKSDLLGTGGDGRTNAGTPGFVRCGAGSCDVGSGNMCYVCSKTSAPICHTMDLPTQCSSPAFILCDGDEDCEPDERCAEGCPIEGSCSIPDRLCRN